MADENESPSPPRKPALIAAFVCTSAALIGLACLVYWKSFFLGVDSSTTASSTNSPMNLNPRYSTIAGTVVDWNGDPLPGLTVTATQVQPISGYESFEAMTSADGTFKIVGVFPSSAYILKPWSDKWTCDTAVQIDSAPEARTAMPVGPLRIERAFSYVTGGIVKDLSTGDVRFSTSQDGLIADSTTGLEWFVGPDRVMNYHQAEAWAKECRAGGGGWRIPTTRELSHLRLEGVGQRNLDAAFKSTGNAIWAQRAVPEGYSFVCSAPFYDFEHGTTQTIECDGLYPTIRVFAVRNNAAAEETSDIVDREGSESSVQGLAKGVVASTPHPTTGDAHSESNSELSPLSNMSNGATQPFVMPQSGFNDARESDVAAMGMNSPSERKPALPNVSSFKIAINGIGPVRLGMSLDEMERAWEGGFHGDRQRYRTTDCFFLSPAGFREDAKFWVVNNKLHHVSITSSSFSTKSGAKVGDPRERLAQLYGDKLKVADDPVLGLNYTFIPSDAKDAAFRLRFYIREDRIAQIDIGTSDTIDQSEFCL